ncbi:hypothetical protein [Bdellovibrio sp. HCB337]|uniref:hypothetical protein n=1 Tax=Bdellovibrio sp. HCB337 TaxID=3394358 RepID=UPI0039A59BC5
MGKLDPKSTGGEGFDFEDKVGAYFLSFLLVGENPFPALRLGQLKALKFQRKVDGWEFDDIILVFESDNISKHLAFSVKSNPHITANKFPADLVELAWKQFCKSTDNPYRSKHDFLGLVTSGASTAATEAYGKLRNFASKHKGPDLDIQIKKPEFTNQSVRDLYDSFTKPSSQNCTAQRAEIIDRLIHFDVNLDNPTSALLTQALSNLTAALVKGDSNELWIKLQHMTKTSRSVSGEINFQHLISELSSFEIKGHRHLESDIKKIKDNYETEIEKIKSTIGSDLSIERTTNFVGQLKKGQINALIGESGVGKSVLLKQWTKESGKQTIWLTASLFKARTLTELNTLLGLQNDLFDILKYGPSEQIVIVDAVDRLTGSEERELLKSFLVKFQRDSGNRHLCVISSQDQIWKTLVGMLSSQNVVFNVISATYFEKAELDLVSKEKPGLTGILKNGPTREILKNPKYLDLALQMAERSSLDTNRVISEPVLIRGFWGMHSDGGANQKQVLLTRLAVEQADTNNFLSPIKDLSASEAQLIDSLVRDGVLKAQDGWIRFSHDLYGDWIRQRFLLSQRQKTIQEIVQRKNNIYWHQAIRLASLEILETDGFDSWKKDVTSLKESGDDVLVDLFLDIAITSLNQGSILVTIKELLFSDNLKVLHRFLERFLAYATAPNPQVMSMRAELELDELAAAQINRVPLYAYWPSLLNFLAKNIEDASGGRVQMAQVAEKWLTFTPNDFPFREDAAKIIFASAKWIFEFKRGSRQNYVRDEVDKKCYQALLAAYPDLPNEVEDLCLKLIGLREDGIERPEMPVVQSKSKAPPPIMPIVTRRRIERKVLPNGPEFERDREFQEVCLASQNFLYIVKYNPSFAAKLLLAAIIEEPQEYEDIHDDGWRMDERLGTSYTQQFYPPLYSSGPFLNFFRAAPQEALDALISLVSLVTDRWAEREKKRQQEVFGFDIEINGNKKFWRGDPQVFLWVMDLANCPDVVVAFLMALEKWLYEKIDAKENVDPWIDQIVQKIDSLAFIGVLVSVAKYSPKLLSDKLRNLLTLPYIIWWDQQFLLQNRTSMVSMISWSGQDRYMANLALKWFGMDHRKTSMEQWAIHFLLNVSEMSELFSTARSGWEREVKVQSDPQLEALVCKFNPANYHVGQLADGTQVWNYSAPAEFLEKHKERFEKNDAQMSLLVFPMNVNKVLDAPSFSEAEFSQLAKTAEYIAKIVTGELEDPILTAPKDCQLAIDGLKLVAAKRKIISFDESSLNVAKENITNALEELWTDPGVAGYPYDRSGQKYDAILAKVIGQLTVGAESDVWVRTQVARLICGPRSVSVSTLISSIASAKASHSFILEILALVFNYSKIRTAWQDADRTFRYARHENKQSKIKAFLSKHDFFRIKIFRDYTLEDRRRFFEIEVSSLMDRFITASVPPAWPSWDFDPHIFEFAKDLDLPSAERNLISLENFTQAASGLPPMQEWDENLRNGWIEFCSSGLDQISKRLTKAIEEHGDAKGTPYKQDNWMINAFAVTYFLRDDVRLDRSLKTFLEVGTDGHYWLDNFGRDFFRMGLKHSNSWEGFKTKLNKIFELALSIEQLKPSRRSWDADEIWCSLVGLDDITIQILPAEVKTLVTDLFPLYERLMKARTGSDKCLSRFISLLCKEAAMSIRIKGLSIVASELKDVNYSDYRQERYISMYSYFLAILWRENQDELRNDKNALANFQQILNGLISVQDPRALELAAQMSSTRL